MKPPEAQKNKRRKQIRGVMLVFTAVILACAARFLENRFAAVKNAISIHAVQPEGTVEQKSFNGTLKLGTFNIAHGRGTNEPNFSRPEGRRERLGRIATLLKEQDVDIAVLNEVDFDAAWTGHENQAGIIAQAAGFDAVEERTDGSTLGRGSESINEPVFEPGSRSALVVPMRAGNAARRGPATGKGGAVLQNRSWETWQGL